MRIEKIHIEGFRGVENQTIENIHSALILIGKNNSGKSAILSALRTFWGDYTPSENDFYKTSLDLLIEICFIIDDDYLKSLFYNVKVGFTKLPSTVAEYNEVKVGTVWEDKIYNEFKIERVNGQQSDLFGDTSTFEQFGPIWIAAMKKKLHLQNGYTSIVLRCNKQDCKLQYEINGESIKDITSFLPQIAFIDDTRNFYEEESGKAKSITSSIFNLILKNQIFNENEFSCKDCNNRNCEETCINDIKNKQIEELTVNELEKLINFKTRSSSGQITNIISNKFAGNYRPGYKINIIATSSVDKSFTISTKIYDPVLNSEINLSNVGAGIRSIYILSLLQSYQEMMGEYALFIIEEPELYLHPELQRTMAKTLFDISNKSQVVFTTHSPIMLNQFKSEDVRKVTMDLEQYKTIVELTTLDAILLEIGYSSQDILNTDFLLFVEGQDDLNCLCKLINKYYDIDLSRISIIDTKSCQNIETYATLRFLKKTTMSENFAIIRDSDTIEKTALKTKIENQMRENIHDQLYLPTILSHLHITKPSSIEGYMIDIDLLLQHHIFINSEKLKENLHAKLADNKQRHLLYFSEKNSNAIERISSFENSFDNMILEPIANIEWIKENIRGHDLFGYLNASRIPMDTYVNELPNTAFEDIITFLDTLEYFRSHKK